MDRLVFGHASAPTQAPDLLSGRVRQLVLYTDTFVIHGSLQTRARRLTDALNSADEPFLVMEDVAFEAHEAEATVDRAGYAQINLATVLFAHEPGGAVEALPELRTVKVTERALVSLPPFRIVGNIHVLPERSLRDALRELIGRFVPVTDATYWSDELGIPRTTVPMLAFNHERSQILAPYLSE